MGSLQEQTLSVGSSHTDHVSTSEYNEDGLSLVRYSATDQSDHRKSSCNNDDEDDDAFINLPEPAQRSDLGNLSNTLLGSQRLSSQGNQEDLFFFQLDETTKSHSESVENQQQQQQQQQKMSTLVFTEHHAQPPSYDSSPPRTSALFLSPRSEQHHDSGAGCSKDESCVETQTFERSNLASATTTPQRDTFQNLEAIPSTTPVQLETPQDFRQTSAPPIDQHKQTSYQHQHNNTLEELLENNLAILPNSLGHSSSASTNVTTGSSFNSSEKYRALLERVKRLPLLHAQEQQELINSYHENNTLPAAQLDDKSIDFQEVQQQVQLEGSRQYETGDSPTVGGAMTSSHLNEAGVSLRSKGLEFGTDDTGIFHQSFDADLSSQKMDLNESGRSNQFQYNPSTSKLLQEDSPVTPNSNDQLQQFHQMTAFNDSRKFSNSFELSPLPRHLSLIHI